MSISWVAEISENLVDTRVGGKATIWHLVAGIYDPRKTKVKALCGKTIHLPEKSLLANLTRIANEDEARELHEGIHCGKCSNKNQRDRIWAR
jgi:cytochrome c-type biogenesis protein CcmH/NrfF